MMSSPPVMIRLLRLPQQWLILLVRAYRLLLSPWLGSSCRFEPTCSAYALTALARHGARRGGWLTTQRLARCHPFCAGGHDPVPPVAAPPVAPAPPAPAQAMLRAARVTPSLLSPLERSCDD